MERFFPYYYLPTADNFYQGTYDKKEFRDIDLSKVEKFPEHTQLLSHQLLISRMISPLTLLNRILLVHYMGTGKTCSATAIAEEYIGRTNTNKKIIVIVHGPLGVRDFAQKIIEDCTDKYYESDIIDKNSTRPTTKEEYEFFIKQGKKLALSRVLQRYEITTHEKFGRRLELIEKELNSGRGTEQQVKRRFSDTVIILDEVHHIRKDTLLYPLYKKFFHMLFDTNTKIVLMTGTPMWDSPYEILDTMGLIIKDEIKPETDFNNTQEYYSYLSNNVFKGYISYLRFPKSFGSSIEIINGGNSVVSIEDVNLNLKMDIMSQDQGISYLEAWEADNEDFKNDKNGNKKRSAMYIRSRQASLFVYNKKYGRDLFHGENRIIEEVIIKGKKSKTYGLRNDILQGNTNEEKLEDLRKYSCKFSSVIEEILKPENQKNNVFIFTESVKGSGAILLGLILEKFTQEDDDGISTHFRRYRLQKEDENRTIPNIGKAPRYVILTGATTNDSEARAIIDEFNKPENKYGEYIRVIIGSMKVSEGISLKNVRQFHSLAPHWNMTEIDQAFGRVKRAFSHEDLLKDDDLQGDLVLRSFFHCIDIKNVKEPVKEIQKSKVVEKENENEKEDENEIKEVEIEEEKEDEDEENKKEQIIEDMDMNTKNIDLFMYSLGVKKDKKIKIFERIVKESAIDCQFAKERNKLDKSYDSKRECEYEKCDYICKGDIKFDNDLDLSTYNLYYKDYDDIIEYINRQFKKGKTVLETNNNTFGTAIQMWKRCVSFRVEGFYYVLNHLVDRFFYLVPMEQIGNKEYGLVRFKRFSFEEFRDKPLEKNQRPKPSDGQNVLIFKALDMYFKDFIRKNCKKDSKIFTSDLIWNIFPLRYKEILLRTLIENEVVDREDIIENLSKTGDIKIDYDEKKYSIGDTTWEFKNNEWKKESEDQPEEEEQPEELPERTMEYCSKGTGNSFKIAKRQNNGMSKGKICENYNTDDLDKIYDYLIEEAKRTNLDVSKYKLGSGRKLKCKTLEELFTKLKFVCQKDS
jgi:Type III restriction enzyme, res subunit/Helicase conserved C-terminal domain